MKYYAKPSLEVISMKTSENIADNPIKTLYESANGSDYTLAGTGLNYDPTVDLGSGNGSVVNG